jgi:hypothetical protein
MSSTFVNRRRRRLTAALVAAVASLAVAAGTYTLPSTHGAQTARSSWSAAPQDATASIGHVHPNRSSWS